MSATAPQPTPRRAGVPARVALALALTGAGFAAVVAITDAAGFGRDLHTLRVVASSGVLLVAMLTVVWPGRATATRVQALALGVVLAALAWWRVPCRFDGPHLFRAGAQRDAMTLWLASLPPDDVKPLPRIRDTVETLAADYPSLCEEARAALDHKIEEVVEARVQELRELSATDPAGFVKSAPARKEIATAFPDMRARLVAAEEQWGARWAKFTAVGYAESDMSQRFVRLGCLEGERMLLDFPTLDDSPGRLREARRVFFHAAHESAEKEVSELHGEQQFDRAFNVALNHKREWASLFDLLTAEERQGLIALLVRCEPLRTKGDAARVEAAPEPRVKP